MILAADGRASDGLRLLEEGCAAGEIDALLLLGLWCLEGRWLSRDAVRARNLIGRAGSAGHIGAGRTHAGLLACGIGGAADWPAALSVLDRMAAIDPLSARQRDAIAAMALDPQGRPLNVPSAHRLSARPDIVFLPGLASAAECALLIALAEGRFKPALIYHEGRQAFVADPIRRSETAGFPIVAEWPFVRAINLRIAAASGSAADCGEPLQILRYGAGQEYRPHLDAVPGMANPRVATLILWLTDDYEGGETWFAPPGPVIRGRIGDALLFRNLGDDGRPDPAARHAGLPVRAGTKIVASRWIRARPAGPEGFGPHEARPPGISR